MLNMWHIHVAPKPTYSFRIVAVIESNSPLYKNGQNRFTVVIEKNLSHIFTAIHISLPTPV